MNTNIVFIGGDMRMIYAAEALSARYSCYLCGLGEHRFLPQHREGSRYDIAVLPIMTGDAVKGCGVIAELLNSGGTVFAGRAPTELKSLCAQNRFALYDYLEREELAVLNAQATAEGAVGIAVNELPRTIRGSSVLVLGFGRIGKLSARYFSALGADVAAAARKRCDLAWIRACGYTAVDFRDETSLRSALGKADIILNTVPAQILAGERAGAVRTDAALIELSSVPCTAGETHFRVTAAGGLPGKTAPLTAGHIIAGTIENILTERSMENGGT